MTWAPADWQGWPLPPELIGAVRERMSTISIPVYTSYRSFVRRINETEIANISEGQQHLLVVAAWRFRRQMGRLAPPEPVARVSQQWLDARRDEKTAQARAGREERQARRGGRGRRPPGGQVDARLI